LVSEKTIVLVEPAPSDDGRRLPRAHLPVQVVADAVTPCETTPAVATNPSAAHSETFTCVKKASKMSV